MCVCVIVNDIYDCYIIVHVHVHYVRVVNISNMFFNFVSFSPVLNIVNY